MIQGFFARNKGEVHRAGTHLIQRHESVAISRKKILLSDGEHARQVTSLKLLEREKDLAIKVTPIIEWDRHRPVIVYTASIATPPNRACSRFQATREDIAKSNRAPRTRIVSLTFCSSHDGYPWTGITSCKEFCAKVYLDVVYVFSSLLRNRIYSMYLYVYVTSINKYFILAIIS